MKTTNYNRNNSASQYWKPILRNGVLAACLMMFSFVLFAQNNLKQQLSRGSNEEVVLVLVNEKINSKSAALTTEFSHFELTEETDKELEIENWMTDAEFFSSFNLTEEAESELNLENWMVTGFYFLNNQIEEHNTELTIEGWMTNENFWRGEDRSPETVKTLDR